MLVVLAHAGAVEEQIEDPVDGGVHHPNRFHAGKPPSVPTSPSLSLYGRRPIPFPGRMAGRSEGGREGGREGGEDALFVDDTAAS
jgi:hypothetical protein